MVGSRPSIISLLPATTTPSVWAGARFACGTTTRSLRIRVSRRIRPHANMEIITYVRDGAITHEDSLGNKGRTEAGDVQVMSAGSGIRHAEYNRERETTRIFQIWIEPNREGGKPSWGAKPFPKGDRAGSFVVLASGFGTDPDALPIRAEARVLGATLKAGEIAEYTLGKGHHGYLVPAEGEVEVNGVSIKARDGAAIEDEAMVKITALKDSEIILVDAA